jgi:predicted acylesterase/phospholipase RssA
VGIEDNSQASPASEPGTAPSPPADDDGAIGLALSGGGVRATLFSLGVIIGLIETGCHRRIRCVTSVSGGSILNAALAHGPTLSRLTLDEFEPCASALARSLAWRGVFAFDVRSLFATGMYGLQVAVLSGLPIAFGLLSVASSFAQKSGFDPKVLDFGKVPWAVVGIVGFAVAAVGLLLSRGVQQQAKYRALLKGVTSAAPKGSSSGLNVADWTSPVDGASGVMHVLVATDLLSGAPTYISREFVHCAPYGWSGPGDIETAEAVYSSAAFPAVFPPKRIKTSRLRFQNGEMGGELPGAIRLVDGGVFNNLGTDWFAVLEQNIRDPWAFGELKITAPRIERRNTIVVNAGAPSKRLTRLWMPMPVARIMSVLYDNTVRPRVELLDHSEASLIDIAQSPIDLVRRLTKRHDGAGARAHGLIALFEGRGDEFWKRLIEETSGTATKLSKVGERSSARLMLHGYLSAVVLAHLRFGGGLPSTVRGEEFFLKLVDKTSNAAHVPMATPVGAEERG